MVHMCMWRHGEPNQLTIIVECHEIHFLRLWWVIHIKCNSWWMFISYVRWAVEYDIPRDMNPVPWCVERDKEFDTICSSLEMRQMICRWIRAIRYPRWMDDRDSISRWVESMCEVSQCTDCELSKIVRYIQVIDSFKWEEQNIVFESWWWQSLRLESNKIRILR